MSNLQRARDLEQAIGDYLDYKNLPYLRIEHYRCPQCGFVGRGKKTTGFPDFLVIDKPMTAIEAKTGKGRLTTEQKLWQEIFKKNDIPYILARDTVDAVLEAFGDA